MRNKCDSSIHPSTAYSAVWVVGGLDPISVSIERWWCIPWTNHCFITGHCCVHPNIKDVWDCLVSYIVENACIYMDRRQKWAIYGPYKNKVVPGHLDPGCLYSQFQLCLLIWGLYCDSDIYVTIFVTSSLLILRSAMFVSSASLGMV